jgi:pimeloyl-ACP methyl ester carboxylesterase
MRSSRPGSEQRPGPLRTTLRAARLGRIAVKLVGGRPDVDVAQSTINHVARLWSGSHSTSKMRTVADSPCGRSTTKGRLATQSQRSSAQPVFIAQGDRDPMILPHYSYLLAGLIPHARIKIYPDSAHGFLFQHHAEFAADVAGFLHDR